MMEVETERIRYSCRISLRVIRPRSYLPRATSLNVHIPTAQRVNRRSIREIAHYKNEVQEQIHRKAGHDV